MVILSEGSLALLQNWPPRKQKDPGSFTISCNISDFVDEKSLENLGASINVIPYTMFRKLGLFNLKPTRMTLQLVGHSIRHPRGIVEDVLFKVDKFIFLVDFVILDVDEEVIFSSIDVSNGKMTLRVGDEEVIFSLSDAMKHPSTFDNTCYFLDGTYSLVDECVQEMMHEESFEESLEDPHVEDAIPLLTSTVVDETM
ncbi:uncharacterized protein LOC120265206 [Dioscorea cayenensis subsp. rotundata]|uniref:Uncharacterized protein LOC120265206 n=1 Tax=Dioscorea cayennensis subsp. rotundata TaxID=55577 RepID=A0AB40BNM1_DIOCR|nr:uncharacterized protein LOC120265206 [Dioscorea cayenensis subsp. rotundata]